MQQTKRTPTFNMKAVVRETGVKPDTLRAWERRYGLPMPDRSHGGHRLYSQRDIDTLKWLVARQDEGISISHAVELWGRLESQGQDPLLVEAVAGEQVQSSDVRSTTDAGERLTELRQQWIAACKNFDEQTAERVLANAFSLYPPEQVSFDLLQRGLREIGDGWYQGTTSVQQEHFASHLALRRLEAMAAGMAPPTRPGRILIGCPPGEDHTFSSLIQTVVLRRRGWDVVYLGASVPVEQLGETLANVQPHLAVFSAQQLITAATLRDLAEMLHDNRVPLAYGGRIFNLIPELSNRISGHFLGESLQQTGQAVERLLTTPQPTPEAQPISMEYRQALAVFQQRQQAVEAAVWYKSAPFEISNSDIRIASKFLSSNISAALALGDIRYLNTEIAWIDGLLSNLETEPAHLAIFLKTYHEALTEVLGENGLLIVDWFNQEVLNT